MCGICGIIEPSGQRADQTTLRTMRDAMVHRGPDDAGEYFSLDRRVGLGFRRLSIVDLSPAGHQPMSNEDGTIWIVFNGEIYNHQDLRAGLIERGHTYRSKSDTETIIHLYEEKGEACLEDLRGMFGLAIWDSKKQRLFFARDRIGVKPFYYTTINGSFRFASEIKSLVAASDVPRAMNEQAMYDYLTFFSVPAPNTLFKDIYKLPAGHYGFFQDGQLSIHQYWDPTPQEDSSRSEQDWVDSIRESLQESIKLRMMSDVPFGAYLSGGIDSSLITVMMHRLLHEPIKTFSVSFKDLPEFNELEYAKQISKEFGTAYHEVQITADDLWSYLPKLIYSQDEPLADWVCFPLYYVSKLVRDNGVIVAQVGEGSDELFCGYEGYMYYLQTARGPFGMYYRLPRWIKAIGYKFAQLMPNLRKQLALMEHLRRAINNEFLFWGGAIGVTEYHKKILLQGEYRRRQESSYRVVNQHLTRLQAKNSQADMLQKMTYLEFKQRLPELLLMRVDKISMSTSIEARVPFLDYKFVETMMKVPTSLKTKGGVTKYILKKAAETVIPDNIIYRKKMGFGAPIALWLREEKFNHKCRDIVLSSFVGNGKYFSRQEVERLFEEHLSSQQDHGVPIWMLMNLALWHDFWIIRRDDQQPNRPLSGSAAK